MCNAQEMFAKLRKITYEMIYLCNRDFLCIEEKKRLRIIPMYTCKKYEKRAE